MSNPLVCNFCLGQMMLLRLNGKIIYICEECHKDEEGVVR